MKVTDNIFVLSGSYFSAVGDAATLGDVYGVRTSDGVILIDCGAPVTGLKMIRETLEYFKVLQPITHLIITHAHWDHCGCAKELQDIGAKVIVGEEDVKYCINGGVKGMNSPFDDGQVFPAFKPDIIIKDDQVLELDGISFEFIKIPGHTPGSMAILAIIDGKKVMFTGDALQPDGITLDFVTLGWQGDPAFDRQAITDSMMKLMRYETDMILPGHGRICLRNGTRVLRLAAQTAFMTMR
ncbi:MAG: MBL fold metallo-hydrolase [Oscillospiraceae bacterium]|jgi:glyoxylase-like metal-dependent hydrolase (beta-lactamase superfamily II)|nr:MBL fold metallo-hydrolase [Oscillospiraceae bacterium]